MFRNRKLIQVSLLCILGWLATGCNEDINNSDTPSDGSGGGEPTSVAAALEQVDQEIGELDHSTSVSGTDANGDGVRDDIESFIASLPDSEEQRNALRQVSIAIADAMLLGADGNTDKDTLRASSIEIGRAVKCLWNRYGGGSAANEQLKLIRQITANTPERFNGYMQFNTSTNGFALQSPEGEVCDD